MALVAWFILSVEGGECMQREIGQNVHHMLALLKDKAERVDYIETLPINKYSTLY